MHQHKPSSGTQFYRVETLPVSQPAVSHHCRQTSPTQIAIIKCSVSFCSTYVARSTVVGYRLGMKTRWICSPLLVHASAYSFHYQCNICGISQLTKHETPGHIDPGVLGGLYPLKICKRGLEYVLTP